MGAIKRNITDISNIKRGAVQMSAVYRGADLIWPSTPTPTGNVIQSFALVNSSYRVPVEATLITSFEITKNGYSKNIYV